MPDPSLEKKKLNIKEVGLKGAIVHFWTYYKWFAIIPAIVLGMLIYSICAYRQETKTYDLKIAMINAHKNGILLFDAYSESIGHEVVVDTNYFYPTNEESIYIDTDMASSLQKLSSEFQSGLIDMMVTNSRCIKEYTTYAFRDLREILDADQLAQLEAQERVYYLESEEGESIPVGILVSGLDFFEPAYPGSEEKHYLVISKFTDKKEEEKLLMEYVFFS